MDMGNCDRFRSIIFGKLVTHKISAAENGTYIVSQRKINNKMSSIRHVVRPSIKEGRHTEAVNMAIPIVADGRHTEEGGPFISPFL